MHNSDIEHMFEGKATFELLTLVVGFTYVGVVRDFLSILMKKSALLSKIKLLILKKPESADPGMLEIALHQAEHSEHGTEVNQLTEEWQEIYSEIFIEENVETGSFFNWAGPYLAMGVYIFVHPPLVYTPNSFYDWSVVYSMSTTILFAFIGTLWYVEEYVLRDALKQDIMRFASKVRYANIPMKPKTTFRSGGYASGLTW